MRVQLDQTDAMYKAFRHLNKTPPDYLTRSRIKLQSFADEHFQEDTLSHRLVHALGTTQDIAPKEVLESFEFYARVRRRVRTAHMADLCCGHGLVGLLFGALEKQVEKVTLIDHRRSAGAGAILDAASSVAPWLVSKVNWIESEVEDMAGHLEPGTTVTGVHACGKLTDHCIDVATRLRSRVAVMPCCYGPIHSRGPEVLERMLDPQLVVDVDRTYRLEAKGYTVDWQFIPRVITPRNRILVGVPRGMGTTEDAEDTEG